MPRRPKPLRIRKLAAATQPTKHASPDDDLTQIRCSTCHVTHGDPQTAPTVDLKARRAARPMLKAGASAQCAQCHGLDASRLMLYWHDPTKRRATRGLLQKQE